MRRGSPTGLGMLALVVLLVALALASCSSSEGDDGTATAGPDPASMAPQSAAVYAELVVRPGNDVADGVLAAARKVLRVQDPVGELTRLIDEQLAEEDSSFARDFEPWLGSRVGLFVTRPPRRGVAGLAVIAAVRDRKALTDAVARQRANGTLRQGGSYRGVAYDLDSDDGVPNALVGDWYVAGRMDAFRAAVDTFKGGANLADSARFDDAVEPLDDDSLAFAYADPTALLANVDLDDVQEDEGFLVNPPPGYLPLLRSLRQADPVTLALTARADEIALELRTDVGGTPLADLQDGGVSIGELPGDSWLALATPALGPLVRSVLDAANAHDDAARQVRGALGLDLDRDLLDPLGGLAAFARGTSVLDLGGGIALKMSDAGAARTLLTRLRALVGAAGIGVVRRSGDGFELQAPRVPQPIVVDALGDRVAAGYGRFSANDLLNPQERFDESPGGKAALATLGEGFKPSLVVLVPPIAQLLESLDAIGIADMSEVLPYVRAYRSLAVGTQRDDDRVTVRVVAALR